MDAILVSIITFFSTLGGGLVALRYRDHLNLILGLTAGVLVGIASRWGEFQRVARTMLMAAGMAPESLLVCDATKAGWKRGLAETAGVVCDAVTCQELPKGCRAIEFRLLGQVEKLRAAEAAACSL